MAAADGLVLFNYPKDQTSTSFTSFTVDEANDYAAFLVRIASENTIARGFFNLASINGAPSIEMSLQGVTSAGIPDGIIKSSGNAKATWSPSSAGAGWQTFSSSYTPSPGERLTIVFKLISGTSFALNVRIGGSTLHMPRGQTFNATGSVTSQLGTPAVFGLKGAGSSWCFGNPISLSNANAITTASIIEEGNLWTVPSDVTIRVIGIESAFRMSASTTGEFRIYQGSAASSTTPTQSITTDSTIDVQSTGATAVYRNYFPSPVTITGGNGFRITVRTTAGTITLLEDVVVDPEDLLAFGASLLSGYRTRRTTGDFTEDTRRTAFIAPIIDLITGSGGGGSTVVVPSRRQIVLPRSFRQPVRPVIVTTTAAAAPSVVPITRTVVRTARPTRTTSPAAIVPVQTIVSTNVYLPILQSRRLAIRERHIYRPARPTTLTVVTPGPAILATLVRPSRPSVQVRTVKKAAAPIVSQVLIPGPSTLVPVRSMLTRQIKAPALVQRAQHPAIAIQQMIQQTVLISSPRVVR